MEILAGRAPPWPTRHSSPRTADERARPLGFEPARLDAVSADIDVSTSLISLIAQFVDPALRRYASAGGGMNIVDDRHGYRPADTKRWLKDSFLDAERTPPLSIVERQACY